VSKICSICKKDLPLELFHIGSKSPDGLQYSCKECRAAQAKIYRQSVAGKKIAKAHSKSEKVKKYQANYAKTEKSKLTRAAYAKTDAGKSARRLAIKRWEAANPVKRSAKRMVGYRIKTGEIIRQPCEVCGDIKVQAHHLDYAKPLDVMWLCRKDHVAWHKEHGQGLNG